MRGPAAAGAAAGADNVVIAMSINPASTSIGWTKLAAIGLVLLAGFVTATGPAYGADAKAGKQAASAQKVFDSPEDATKALVAAMRIDDPRAIYAILGPGSEPLINTGDKVADAAERAQFVAASEQSTRIDREGDSKATFLVGGNNFPFPFPLVRTAAGWRFDAKGGAEEIVNRRIGGNELAAIQVCLAYVDAQREYSLVDRNHDGLVEYAQKLVSTPGKQDGLYWPASGNAPESPLGPLGAKARSEGYGNGSGDGAYHGYYYRILTAQGKDAPGGAYDYIAKGRMIGGFGLVAYPSRWGASGVMTFICNHHGVVYEKNLGPNTRQVASSMTRFNPDATWTKAEH